MKYCKECGAKLEGDEKFCPECGMKIEEDTSRQTNYEGEIQKCPNCGEVLNSFTPVCPSCGFELRNAKSSSGVTEFVKKLQEIESNGMFNGRKIQDEAQKISMIRNFPIPNTKEDLYEFLVLSKSNIEVDLYKKSDSESVELALSNAWKAKFEQAYQKAKWLFKDDERMIEIQEMYNELDKAIKYAKWTEVRHFVIGVIAFIAFIFVAEIISFISNLFS